MSINKRSTRVKAVVKKVTAPSGDHKIGFAQCTLSGNVGNQLKKGDLVSFSTIEPVWPGVNPPLPGQVVQLGCITQFDKGWRALKASPVVATTEEANHGTID